MDKLYVILTTIFIHILFLLTTGGIMVALYVAAVDRDRACLLIAGLILLAKQCVHGLWYFQKQEFRDLRRAKIDEKTD